MSQTEASAYDELREVAYALFRSNIDWQAAARSCGDSECRGDCRFVATIRQFVAEHDGGILPPPEGAEKVLVSKTALKLLYECAKDYDRAWAYVFREMFDGEES